MLLLANQALLTEVLWRLRNVRRLDEAISPPWEHACGASRSAVFALLRDRGYARVATGAESLVVASTHAQLKAIALEMGLKASGSKQKLVEAILSARPEYPDPPGPFVVLTSEGSALLEARIMQRSEDELSVRSLALLALRRGQLREALALVQQFQARHSVESFLPDNPIGIRVPDVERVEDAAWIMGAPQGYVLDLPEEVAARVKDEATLSAFGFAYSAELAHLPGGRFESATEASRSLELVARYMREVKAAQAEWGAAKVKVEFFSFPGDQGCQAGRKMAKRKWPSSPIPPFPSSGCSRKGGCTCSWALDIAN